MNMKKILIATMAIALAASFAVSAEAASHKKVSADVQALCKDQAAKKFSAVHFLKRRNFVNNCVAQHATANMHAKAKSITPDQMAKPTTTGQAPKQAQKQ
jgi:hypothetical protein